MTAAGLDLISIGKRYGSTTALHSIDLSVEEGELVVLVGPSGSGKSTLLRVIAGLITPDEGQVIVAGRDVTSLPPHERNIAMMFQSYALFPHMTVAENISFGMEARREPRALIATRLQAAAQSLDLERLLHRYPRELSGGERQRVALARAMIREPRLFLMDEPLSNLDAQLRVHMRAEFLRLHARLKTTTVYVTHDQIEALSIGDRIGVMREGRLEQIGAPLELYHHPSTLFVARFLGSPAMNTFDVVSEGGVLRWLGNEVALDESLPPGEWIAGIRPEHIYLRGSRWSVDGPGPRLQGQIEVVELAGDQIFLEVNVGEKVLLVRAEPELQARPGDAIELWLDQQRLHLFDRGTHRAHRGAS